MINKMKETLDEMKKKIDKHLEVFVKVVENTSRDKDNKFYRDNKTEKSKNDVGVEMIGRSI